MKKLLGLGLVLAGVLSAQANLISNAGFETWWDNWNGWGNYTYNDSMSYMDNSGSLGGSMAISLQNETAGDQWSGQWQNGVGAPVAGETYSASAFFTKDAATAFSSAFIKLQFWNGATELTGFTNTFAVGELTAGTWSPYEVSGVTPVGATAARINVGVDFITTAGNLYVDGASLTAVPEPVSASLLGLGILTIYAVRRKLKK